jgi:hypothetical protein
MNPKKPSSKSAPASTQTGISRVALTLKISKSDYLRLMKLRLKEVEAGREVSHQDLLYSALRNHLRKHGV